MIITEMWADEEGALMIERRVIGWNFVPTKTPGRPRKNTLIENKQVIEEMERITNPHSFRDVLPVGIEVRRLTIEGIEIL